MIEGLRGDEEEFYVMCGVICCGSEFVYRYVGWKVGGCKFFNFVSINKYVFFLFIFNF